MGRKLATIVLAAFLGLGVGCNRQSIRPAVNNMLTPTEMMEIIAYHCSMQPEREMVLSDADVKWIDVDSNSRVSEEDYVLFNADMGDYCLQFDISLDGKTGLRSIFAYGNVPPGLDTIGVRLDALDTIIFTYEALTRQ